MTSISLNPPLARRRAAPSSVLSMTHPNLELFQRQRALLRKAVPAGFPSPADDYVERRLSLDEHLIRHKESTFFMRVSGHSMRELGIFDGDLLIVDRSVPASHGCVRGRRGRWRIHDQAVVAYQPGAGAARRPS